MHLVAFDPGETAPVIDGLAADHHRPGGAGPGAAYQAAANLGATPFAALRTITFPLLMPAILAGAVFAFIEGFDAISVAIIALVVLSRSIGLDRMNDWAQSFA